MFVMKELHSKCVNANKYYIILDLLYNISHNVLVFTISETRKAGFKMSFRTTEARLNAIVDSINEITGSPMTSYTKDKNGMFKANAGNYHLDWAYGGVKLVRMCKGGGCENITNGYLSKPRVDELMCAYRDGLLAGKK
jgi:hypothetical protein